MENAEKVQEISSDKAVETPEEVQQEAESSTNSSEESPPEEESSEVGESTPEQTSTTPPPSDDSQATAMDENPSDESDDPEQVVEKEEKPPLETTEEPSTENTSEEKEPTEAVVEKEPTETVEAEEPTETVEAEEPTEAVEAGEPTEAVEEVKTEEVEGKDSIEESASDESKEEEPESDVEEIEEEPDFTEASKEELVVAIKELSKEERVPVLDRTIKAIKPRYDELHENERLSALNKFELEGNDPNAFEYHGDELDKEFNTIYSSLRTKRNRYYKDLESQRDDNLKKKEQLLEQLREIVDGEESNTSINGVKEIQAEWKKVGPVPGAHNKTLWANYNALLDRFYDQRSIYFELKDLDRKKNLKVKEEICERAEALAGNEDLKAAIVQLNELHEEYKHAGSVPREDQEALWQRFKTASDAIYARRKDFFDNLKEEFEQNYVKKKELADEAESYTAYNSESITEWNHKTKEIQQLQKKWEAIGGLPRDKAKAINKQFWGSFKKFFNNKNQFFKRLESMRDENLERKEQLITQAEELKESSDWADTTNKYKALQAQWKDIGPVPEKVRSEVYKRFKTACDHFFDRRREQNSEQDKQYEENLKLKLQICDQIEAIADADDINLDDIYDLIDNHAQIGFVPRNAIKKERARFDGALDKILTLEDLQDGDRKDLKNHIQLSRMKNSPGGDKKIQRRGHSIKRKISELENDISTWNTNMEFFAASATADKLKADLQQKIEAAQGEIENLKSQLAAINE